MAVALEEALVTSRNLQDNAKLILQEAIVSWKENGNLTYGQPNHEPAETREKKNVCQLLQTQAMDLFLSSLRNYSDLTGGSNEALLHTSKRKVDVFILHFVSVS